MIHEFDDARILRPEGELLTFAEFPEGEILEFAAGSNIPIVKAHAEFEVEIPDGIGDFEVISKCGKFKGTMRIEQEPDSDYRILRKVMMKPVEMTTESSNGNGVR